MTSLAQATADLRDAYDNLQAALAGDNWTLIAYAFTAWKTARDEYRTFLLTAVA